MRRITNQIVERVLCGVLSTLLCVCSISGCAGKAREQELFENEGIKENTEMEETETMQRVVKTEFTTEEFLEDYDALWEILETDYVFLSELEPYGVDVETIKEGTRKQISEREMEVTAFYMLLRDMLGEMRGIAHLGLLDTYLYDMTLQSYHNETITNGWRRAVENLQTQKTYEQLAERLSRTNRESPRISSTEGHYDAERKMVVFQMKSFDIMLWKQEGNYVQKYIESLDGAPIEHIVFDITGNPGGAKNYWWDNITSPFGGDYTYEHWWYLQDTDLTREYCRDMWKPQPISEMPETHPIPEFVRRLGLTQFIHITDEFSWEGVLDGDALTAKRWVVMDNYSYSAADSFADFCKSTGWATLVGKRTGGDGGGCVPFYEALPNTGILVRFSAILAENASGELNAIYGTSPDYYSEREETPMETLYRVIEEDGKCN